jgi:hypothetical protein
MKIEEEGKRIHIIKHVIQFNRPLADGFLIMTGLLLGLLAGIIQIAVVVAVTNFAWHAH